MPLSFKTCHDASAAPLGPAPFPISLPPSCPRPLPDPPFSPLPLLSLPPPSRPFSSTPARPPPVPTHLGAAPAFGFPGDASGYVRFSLPQAAACITARLSRWYAQQRQLGHHPSEVGHLQAAMFGTKKKPYVKTKAHETIWLFRFFVERFLPEECGSLEKGVELLKCARYLHQWNTYLDGQPDTLTRESCDRLEELYMLHVIELEPAGVKPKPKHHLCWHMTERSRCRGVQLNVMI